MKRYGKFNLTKPKKNVKITKIYDDSLFHLVMARLRAFQTYQLLDGRKNTKINVSK